MTRAPGALPRDATDLPKDLLLRAASRLEAGKGTLLAAIDGEQVRLVYTRLLELAEPPGPGSPRR